MNSFKSKNHVAPRWQLILIESNTKSACVRMRCEQPETNAFPFCYNSLVRIEMSNTATDNELFAFHSICNWKCVAVNLNKFLFKWRIEIGAESAPSNMQSPKNCFGGFHTMFVKAETVMMHKQFAWMCCTNKNQHYHCGKKCGRWLNQSELHFHARFISHNRKRDSSFLLEIYIAHIRLITKS